MPAIETIGQPETSQPRELRSFRYFDILLSVFIVVLLISNLVGQKI